MLVKAKPKLCILKSALQKKTGMMMLDEVYFCDSCAKLQYLK
jgi:hypothetical protein